MNWIVFYPNIRTFVDQYWYPSRGLRSSGCWMWSESLSWQTRSPFLLGGPTLTDTQVFSMRHLFLQSLWGSSPMDKYICLKTCCCRAYPPIGLSNIRLRQWVPATDWLEIWWQVYWRFFFFLRQIVKQIRVSQICFFFHWCLSNWNKSYVC